MTEWREFKIKDIADVVGGGTPSTAINEYWNGDIPWLTPKDLTGYIRNFISHGERFITKKGLENSSARLLPKGTVLLTSRAPIGYVAIAENEICTNQGFKSLVPNPDKAHNLFLLYWIKSNVEYLQSIGTGTTFQEISGSVLKDVDIILPPLPEQKAIADVLSSLDDKIDLLTRQNKTLEDLAQAYFRKWFIEDASDEWEIKKLRDFGEIICGKTPPTTNKKFFNGNIPFIKIPDMHNNVYIFDTADTLSEMGAKYQENKFIPPMSICVSCIATVGLVSMNVFLSQTNQQINSLIPKHDKYRYYLFLFLRSYRDELLALGSGGTMTLNINKTLFGDIECYCPDDEILFRFNNVVNPLFGKIYNNCKQIRILSKLRNTLLPKLISGEIRVKM